MRLLNMPEISAAAAAAIAAGLHHDTCLDSAKLHSSISISPLHALHKAVRRADHTLWVAVTDLKYFRFCFHRQLSYHLFWFLFLFPCRECNQ
jgi:hypothetical protein